MNKTAVIALIALGAWACPAHASCDYPAEITTPMPDGATATREEMLAAQKDVKAYVQRMEAYIACLDAESTDLGEEITPEMQTIQIKRHNAAVAAMEQVAERFNVEIRAYKAAQ